jgi:hypothetical protein
MKSEELAERFIDFAANIVRFVIVLEKTAIRKTYRPAIGTVSDIGGSKLRGSL